MKDVLVFVGVCVLVLVCEGVLVVVPVLVCVGVCVRVAVCEGVLVDVCVDVLV